MSYEENLAKRRARNAKRLPAPGRLKQQQDKLDRDWKELAAEMEAAWKPYRDMQTRIENMIHNEFVQLQTAHRERYQARIDALSKRTGELVRAIDKGAAIKENRRG